ncbi:MAG: PDZ domain-containing protein [Verrucomicrobiota bacterium]
MRVADLDDEAREAIHAPASLKGAVIVEIDPDSDAYRAGLRQGFVIEEIDRKPVKSAADAMRIGEGVKKDKPVLMRAWGGGQSRYFTLGGK